MDVRIADSSSGARSFLQGRFLLALLVGALAFLCLLVLRPFLAPMLWAAILAYVTWPLYCRFRAPFRKRTIAGAAAMTLLIMSVGIVPFFALVILVRHEFVDAYRAFTAYLAQGPHEVPTAVRDIPWFGDTLQDTLNRYTLDPAAVGRELADAVQGWKWQFGALIGGVGRNLGKLFVTLITACSARRPRTILTTSRLEFESSE